jgi:ParB family chromosome partitioning protein
MRTKPENRHINLNGISVVPSERLRRLRPEVVDELAESMRVNGLINPITLRPHPGTGFILVAGRHRYEAAKKLKWPSIWAHILEGVDAAQAEIVEIDENLIRAELSPAETAMHLAARKRLYEQLHPPRDASYKARWPWTAQEKNSSSK